MNDVGARIDLLDLTKEELCSLLAEWHQPRYRTDQIWGGLYQRLVSTTENMTDLPGSLRARLARETTLDPLTPVTTLDSDDGQTSKNLFRLPDGAQIESVVMHYERRCTVCVSTQVGCALGCPFCATGQGGFTRNLSAGEIVAQVLFYARWLVTRDRQVTNVVFMGMGEPLANYDATWAAIRCLNDPDGFRLGARSMTVSTVGLVPGIRRMVREPEQVGLAVSLHAPADALRDYLVPVNRRYPLAQLMEAIRDYIDATHRRVTFEYALMDRVNDSDDQARQLAGLVGRLLAKVNLIPLNPTIACSNRPSPRPRVRAFQRILQESGISTTVRLRRGADIQAGCGQLRAP